MRLLTGWFLCYHILRHGWYWNIIIFYKCNNINDKCMIICGISRAEIAGQCTRHWAAVLSFPLTSFSISTILISCNATLPLHCHFPILFHCNHFYCIFYCPSNLLFQSTSFSLLLCIGPSIRVACLLPVAIQYGIFVYTIWLKLSPLRTGSSMTKTTQ